MSGAHLPPPSSWPVTLAAGVTLASAGLVTNWVIGAAGALIAAIALAGWIRDSLGDRA